MIDQNIATAIDGMARLVSAIAAGPPLLVFPSVIAAFVVGWNIVWGPTPKGTPWRVFMPRVLWVAGAVWVASFALLALTWKEMQ